MIYRVILKVSYNAAYFDFGDSAQACQFAGIALEHSTASEDQRKLPSIIIKVINPEEAPDDEE